ncbi:N-acyl-D-amino-acid deacylase family protein [Flexithrix dorotheae]|uniref:N-acyl-D-amino-acid deacylase family protein n=1 Tax=Flexithrix dorotheae TaxID=70993 RepID=UPI00047808A7|nr:D-aminoacylase [Flexithrix dorotheae]
MNKIFLIGSVIFLFMACTPYSYIIENGTVYDGSGSPGVQTDIGIKRDKVAKIGNLDSKKAKQRIDATGMAVSPGFVNNLSWAAYPFQLDGRSLSDLKQGVTLEVFGEGSSLGPYNAKDAKNGPLSFYDNMKALEEKGVSCNFASYVGATTIRINQLGYEDRAPNAEELQKMQELVKESMEGGALGVGSSLIYPPAFFASTEELIALSKEAGKYGGRYISHMRSEGNKIEEAVNELIKISKEGNLPAEIFHLKAAGENNWKKLDGILAKIDSANAVGLDIKANMYNYTGASTGLDACLPPWAQDGGKEKFLERLANPETRKKIISEMESDETDWENFLSLSGKPENILLLEFNQDSLNYLIGKNVGDVARIYGMSPAETIVELILGNHGDIGCAYFLMTEENVKKQIKLPYITFCSDARSIAAEGKNLESMTHPRTYGNFARLLGKYVREEKVIPLEEAIYKLSWLSAQRIGVKQRGKLEKGFFADVVIFNPNTIIDKATFEKPHQYAEGVIHVLVNGVPVIENGAHTGKTPGKFVKGPGFKQ